MSLDGVLSNDSAILPAERVGGKGITPAHTCRGCDARWGGFNRCHCAACHRTLSGPSLFDRHRKDVRGVGTCFDPTEFGAVEVAGYWQLPDTSGRWSS